MHSPLRRIPSIAGIAAFTAVLAFLPSPAPGQTPYQQAVLDHNPILYWTFDEPGDSDNAKSLVNDSPANELVAQGAATRAPSTTTAGGADLGRAASFDASVDPQSRFFAANLAPETPLTAFAVEFWFNVDNTEQRYFSETFAEDGSANQPGVIYNFNPGEFEIFAGGRTGAAVSSGEWRHVVAAFYGAGNGVEIYVDGALAPLIERNGGYNQVHGFGQFAIGNTVLNPQSVTGMIDEYAIYDLGALGDVAARQAFVADIAEHFRFGDAAIDPDLGTASSVNFGSVEANLSAIPLQLSVANRGENETLNITAVSFTGPDGDRFTLDPADGFPASLAPGEAGAIRFSFDCTGEPGAYSAAAEISSNDAAEPMVSVALSIRVRAPAPIAATSYQQAVVEDNPVLYWTFDEAGDTDNARSLVNDDPANELVALGAASRAPSTTTAGGADLGRAAIFDAAADPQSRFHAANLGPTTPLDAFAVEFWFHIDDATNLYFSETFAESGAANQPGIIYNFNPGEFEIFAGGRTGTEVTANEWHHVVVASYGPGNGVEIYVDGVSAPLIDRDGGYSQVQSFGEFAIGNTVRNPQSVTGLIDEYAIYDLSTLDSVAGQQAHVADIALHYSLIPGGFQIMEFSVVSDKTQATVVWESQPGRFYAVDASTGLSNWNELMGNIQATGEETSYTDAEIPAAEGDERYYRVRQTPPPPLLSSDFEDGPGGWTAETLTGETPWELGTPNVPGLTMASSGVNAWGTDLDGDYGPNVMASLRSPVIDLAGVSVPRLTFNYFIDSTADVEGGQLRFLDEAGNALFVLEQIFSGVTEGWTPFSLAAPAAVREQRIVIEFLFLTDGDAAVGAGWYIDDVIVR